MSDRAQTTLTPTGKKYFLENVNFRLGDVIDFFNPSESQRRTIAAAMEVISELQTA